jgi:dienelactone hydrolase
MSASVVLASLFLTVPAYWDGLDPGPFRAGFERIEGRDYSRPYRLARTDAPGSSRTSGETEGETNADARARPIHMSIWYPARAEASPQEVAVTFGDYVGDEEERRRLAERLKTYGFDFAPSKIGDILSEPTVALENAPRAEGPFPLLLFGTALTGPSYLNTVLCEYLATHGYVVVAIPSLPLHEGDDPDFNALSVDAQLRDMEFVLQALHDYPESESGRLGLVAWSFGGVAQALLSMKNPDVRAVVSLDAATGYAYGQKLLESSMFFDRDKAIAPFLHVTDSRESGQVPKSFRYFDEITRGPAYLLTLEGASHAEFTSLASVVAQSFDTAAPDEPSRNAFRRYRLVCLYVRSFLDEVMKNDSAARDFLDVAPTRHGFEGLVLSRRR